MTIEDVPNPKAALRKEMRRRLRGHDRDTGQLLDSLRDALEELEHSKRIAIYCALPDEPDITGLMAALPSHHWLFPRVDGDHLHFHEVTDAAAQLRHGAFDIREPLPSLPLTPTQEIDIFVCPGLAFDPHGGRLGRGRGFYDRMLAEAREGSLKIGVGFAFQMVEDTFTEEHDILMDAVLCHG